MALIGGIDPGLNGAFAVYDTAAEALVGAWDMPVFARLVNRRERKRLDAVAIYNTLTSFETMGVEVMWIEDVAGRGNQIGGATLSFGVGMIHGICTAIRLRLEAVAPGTWKARMRAPAGKEGATQRAEALFPRQRGLFRGPHGGKLDGRAEAAMIALYGVTRL
ncbi:MAG: hypothetical protein ACLGP3_08570 [Acidobacteriota bacterium]